VTCGAGLGAGFGGGLGAGIGAGSGVGTVVVGVGSGDVSVRAAAGAALDPPALSANPAHARAAVKTAPTASLRRSCSPRATAPLPRQPQAIQFTALLAGWLGVCGTLRTLKAVARTGEKLIVDNRRARHDYHLLERVEAGLVLTGTEVKSLRDGRASLQQAYAEVRGDEAWLVGAHISVYDQGNRENHDPDRDRKLLLRRKEIDSLAGKVRERGLTLVPTKLYFRGGRAKVELALARGKELRDKRRDLQKREAQRDMERALKSRR
jgi:SsrA-binding protein